VKKAILALLQPPAAAELDPDQVKQAEGVPAYLRLLGSEMVVRYPVYWQSAKNADFSLAVGSRRQHLKPGDAIYREVEKLVVGTWDTDKVGHGRDAANLGHRSIAVRNIWLIENPSLFAEYTERKKRLCRCAGVNQLPPRISGLKGEREVITHKHGISLPLWLFLASSRALQAVIDVACFCRRRDRAWSVCETVCLSVGNIAGVVGGMA